MFLQNMRFYAYIVSLNLIFHHTMLYLAWTHYAHTNHGENGKDGRSLRRAADVDAGHELGFTRQEVWTIGWPVKVLFGGCLCLEFFTFLYKCWVLWHAQLVF